MALITLNQSTNIGGLAPAAILAREAAGVLAQDPLLPVAWSGTLTTRTDNDTGVVTIELEEFVLTEGDKVSVFWTNADGTTGHRYNMTVGEIVGQTVPIDGGAGTNLPLVNSVVIVGVESVYADDVDCDLLLFIGISGSGRFHFRINDTTTDPETPAVLQPTDVLTSEGLLWSSGYAAWFPNPLAGTHIDSFVFANGNPEAANQIQCAGLYDSEV